MSCLLNVTWLSDSVCTHVTLYALSLCLPLNIIVTAWYRWRNEFVGGHSFGFRAVTRSKKLISKNGNGLNDEQSHVPGEDEPHRISRTTKSGKVQTAKQDEWNTTREPLRDVPSLPKSSWQACGESDAPSGRHGGSGKRCILGTMGRTTAP